MTSEPITTTPSGVRLLAVSPDGTEVNVTEGVMALYDLVIGSMDWGSGFLTVEDALPVAEIAKVCGFGKWEAAQAYIDDHQHSTEQHAFMEHWREQRARATIQDIRNGVGGSSHISHEHVWSSVGRCMWSGCQAIEGAL